MAGAAHYWLTVLTVNMYCYYMLTVFLLVLSRQASTQSQKLETSPDSSLGDDMIFDTYQVKQNENGQSDKVKTSPKREGEFWGAANPDWLEEFEKLDQEVLPDDDSKPMNPNVPWLTVYDTDGTYTEKVPVSQSFSNIEVEGCRNIEETYRMKEQSKMQVIKRIEYPSITLTRCNWISSIWTDACSIPGWTYKGNPWKLQENFLVDNKTCTAWIAGESVALYLKPENGGKTLVLGDIYPERKPKRETVLGWQSGDGYCGKGETWNELENVVVTTETRARVQETVGKYIPERNSIIVDGEELFVDQYNEIEGSLFHEEKGTYFFDLKDIPKTNCDHLRTVVAGNGLIYSPVDENSNLSLVATVLTPEGRSLMTVVLEDSVSLCNKTAYTTSLDGFYLAFYQNDSDVIPTGGTVSPLNISEYEISEHDMLNNKASTMVLELSLALQTDFAATLRALCEAREMSVLNYLSLVGHEYGRTGGRVGNKTGVEVYNYGAVTYAVKGVPINAQIRDYEFCCEELPIRVATRLTNVTNVFMDSRSKVIRPYCTKRICDGAFPFYYHVQMHDPVTTEVEERYYCTKGTPKVKRCPAPLLIKAMSKSVTMELINFTKNSNPKLYNDEIMKKHHLSQLLVGASKSFNADIAHSFIKEIPVDYVPGKDKSAVRGWFRENVTRRVLEAVSGFAHLWESVTATVSTMAFSVVIYAVISKLCIPKLLASRRAAGFLESYYGYTPATYHPRSLEQDMEAYTPSENRLGTEDMKRDSGMKKFVPLTTRREREKEKQAASEDHVCSHPEAVESAEDN